MTKTMGEEKYLDPNGVNNRVRIKEGVKGREVVESPENKKLVFDPVRQNKRQADSIRRQIQESPNGGKDAHAYLDNGVLYITDKPMNIKAFEAKAIKPITVEHALMQKEFGEGIRLVLDLARIKKPLDKEINLSAIQQSPREREMDSIPANLVRHDTPRRNHNCAIYAMLGANGYNMASKKTEQVVDMAKTSLLNDEQIDLVQSEGEMLEFSYYKTDAENMKKGSGEHAFLYLRNKGYIPEGRGLRVYDYQPDGAILVRDPIFSDPGKEPICIFHKGDHFEALSDPSRGQKEPPIHVNEMAKVNSPVPRPVEAKYPEGMKKIRQQNYDHTNSRSERQISNEVQQGETAQMEFVPRNANRYQLPERRFIKLITAMAPPGYEKRYRQLGKIYCKVLKSQGKSLSKKIIDVLEANKDKAKVLFKNSK